MSEPGAPRDPVDEAYLRAEALLDDETARSARRARVLAAAAGVRTPARRAPWRYGGWAAAAVLAVTVVAAARMQLVLPHAPSPPPSRGSALKAPPTPAPAAAPPSDMAAVRPPTRPEGQDLGPIAARLSPVPPADVPPPPPLPLPPVKAPLPEASTPRSQPQPPPPIVSPAPLARELEPAPSRERSASAADWAPMSRAATSASKAFDVAARLRAAAAAGRTAEIEALLDAGGAVDAPDADGDTALMESVRSGQAAAAALLRRRGADPNRRNAAGASPASLAALRNDPALTAALAPPR